MSNPLKIMGKMLHAKGCPAQNLGDMSSLHKRFMNMEHTNAPSSTDSKRDDGQKHVVRVEANGYSIIGNKGDDMSQKANICKNLYMSPCKHNYSRYYTSIFLESTIPI